MATKELINRYEQVPALLDEAMRGVRAEELDRVPAPGKWTIRQIIVHLADAEIVQAGRIRAVAGEPGSRLAAFDQEKWAGNLRYGTLPVETAAALVHALRASTAALLRQLPEEAWSRTGVHDERGVLSLKDIVESSADHGENHVRQIREHRTRFAAVA